MKPFITLLFWLTVFTATAQRIVYVTPAGAGNADGKSWYDALPGSKLAYALDTARAGTEFRVAAGTYYPTTDNNRDGSFRISKPGIKLLGGYKVWTDISAPEKYPTILSGNIGASNTNVDNSFHVVTVILSNSDSAVVDGFTITGGNANGSGTLSINGISLSRNNGGGIYNTNTTSGFFNSTRLIVRNCIIKDNSAGALGGGCYNFSGGTSNMLYPEFYKCVFQVDTAAQGGAIYNANNMLCSIRNCTFYRNKATSSGGGAVWTEGGHLKADNCIFWGNSSVNTVFAPDINGNGSVANNSWSWFDFNNNSLQSTIPATSNPLALGNITGDPLFVNDLTDLHLRSCSPAKGMGAYDWLPTIIYVNKNNRTPGGGNSWSDAYKDLSAALARAGSCTPSEIRVAAGTYYPTSGTDRNASFRIQANGIRLLGGYAANGSGERDIENNITRLSGNIGSKTTNSDNSYHILTVAPVLSTLVDSTTLIEGFRIDSGYASASLVPLNISGPDSSSGGGIYIYADSGKTCKPAIRNCTFSANRSSKRGGAVYVIAKFQNTLCRPRFEACLFKSNISDTGGAVCDSSNLSGLAKPVFINSIFRGNSATTSPALFDASHDSSSLKTLITNCTIAYNNGNTGNYAINTSNIVNISVVVTNSILYTNVGNNSFIVEVPTNLPTGFFYNVQFTHCYICNQVTQPNDGDGDPTRNTNIPFGGCSTDSNPFSDDALHLSIFTTAINYGNVAAIPGDITTDFAGNPRITSGKLDLGAYQMQGNIIYVNAAAANNGDGRSWETAYKNLDAALNEANNMNGRTTRYNINTQIRVASGIYSPQGGRENSFRIFRNGIKLLGGYDSAGKHERNTAKYPTVLSGILNNNYHVLVISPFAKYLQEPEGTQGSFHNDLDSTTAIDGFIIEGGRADGSSSYILAAPYYNGSYDTIRIDRDKGGGIYQVSSKITRFRYVNPTTQYTISAPIISNCIFKNNYSSQNGAAVYNVSDSGAKVAAKFINCIFTDNICSRGGVVNNVALFTRADTLNSNMTFPKSQTLPDFTNCTFVRNTLSNTAIYDSAGSNANRVNCKSTITNCIFWNNQSDIKWYGADTTGITYCLTQNPHSIIAHNIIGNNNIFADTTYTLLQPCSTVLDGGLNAAVTSIPTDIAGNPRILHGIVDMGAYENAFSILYVNSKAPAGGSGLSWTTAYQNLDSALKRAGGCGYTDIYIAEGIYKPANNRDSSFRILRNNVRLFGGYDSSGNGVRDVPTNKTILSGDIGTSGNISDNSYHVLTIIADAEAIDTNTVIDGLTIRNGNAIPSSSLSEYFAFHGWQINNYYGGGIYLHAPNPCGPKIVNCTLDSNIARRGGGAMYIYEANIANRTIVQNSVFSNNKILYSSGAVSNPNDPDYYNYTGPAVYNRIGNSNTGAHLSPAFTNCTFYNNTIVSSGFGFTHHNVITNQATTASPSAITNCLFWNNKPDSIRTEMYGPVTVRNSLLERYGANNVNGNIVGRDPLLDTTNTFQKYRLLSCSPAIDAGSNISATGLSTDFYNNNRIYGEVIDIGAHEYQGQRTALVPTLANNVRTVLDFQTPVAVKAGQCEILYTVQINQTSNLANASGTPIKAQVVIQTDIGNTSRFSNPISTLEAEGENSLNPIRGIIELYFKQKDFDQFNQVYTNHPHNLPRLPNGSNDSIGIANLRSYHLRADNTTLDVVKPGPDSVKWNATENYWEVAFPFTGSGAFYVSTSGNGSLPLTLTNITVQARLKDIVVNWKTAAEINTSRFELERSASVASAFQYLGTVPARSVANGAAYTYTDAQVIPGTYYYYRLKMLDKDGTFTYSPIVKAIINKQQKLVAVTDATATILTLYCNNTIKMVSLYDAVGKNILSQATGNQQPVQLRLPKLPAGVYTVMAITNAGTNSTRIAIGFGR